MTDAGKARRAQRLWYGALPGLPLLALQGLWARRRAPRLAPPPGPGRGHWAGAGQALRLVVLGESPAAGVGVAAHTEGLAAQTGRALARRTGRAVEWEAAGENGIRLRACRERLLPAVLERPPDYAVIVLGVNDTTGLTPRRRWRQDYEALLRGLLAVTRHAVICAGVPPIASFTAVPAPLRHVLGARAQLLDRDIAALVAGMPAVRHLPLPRPLRSEELAADGYHPSALGCRRWGAMLADAMTEVVTEAAV